MRRGLPREGGRRPRRGLRGERGREAPGQGQQPGGQSIRGAVRGHPPGDRRELRAHLPPERPEPGPAHQYRLRPHPAAPPGRGHSPGRVHGGAGPRHCRDRPARWALRLQRRPPRRGSGAAAAQACGAPHDLRGEAAGAPRGGGCRLWNGGAARRTARRWPLREGGLAFQPRVRDAHGRPFPGEGPGARRRAAGCRSDPGLPRPPDLPAPQHEARAPRHGPADGGRAAEARPGGLLREARHPPPRRVVGWLGQRGHLPLAHGGALRKPRPAGGGHGFPHAPCGGPGLSRLRRRHHGHRQCLGDGRRAGHRATHPARSTERAPALRRVRQGPGPAPAGPALHP